MLPPELWVPTAWNEYLIQLTAPPAQPATQLPAPHTPQPPTPATCLDQPITEAKIEVALQKLHNGRSAALLGYTSELLRYAKLVPTDVDSTSCCLVYRCSWTRHSAWAKCPSRGRLHWSRQSSRRVMLQTQLTTDQLQWASLLAGCMQASWFSAWSRPQSSKASDLPGRLQARAQHHPSDISAAARH